MEFLVWLLHVVILLTSFVQGPSKVCILSLSSSFWIHPFSFIMFRDTVGSRIWITQIQLYYWVTYPTRLFFLLIRFIFDCMSLDCWCLYDLDLDSLFRVRLLLILFLKDEYQVVQYIWFVGVNFLIVARFAALQKHFLCCLSLVWWKSYYWDMGSFISIIFFMANLLLLLNHVELWLQLQSESCYGFVQSCSVYFAYIFAV